MKVKARRESLQHFSRSMEAKDEISSQKTTLQEKTTRTHIKR